MNILADRANDSVTHLRALVAASTEVLDHLELLDSCRFGPPAILEAAVADLRSRLVDLDRLSPRVTGVTVAELVASNADGPDATLAGSLADVVRANVRRIHERSASVSLELHRLLADTQVVVSSATGGAGTYDASGRTAVGSLRRDRGLG